MFLNGSRRFTGEGRLTRVLDENPDVQPALVLPAVLHSDELAHLYEWVCKNAARLSGVVANNPGQFELKWPVPVLGRTGIECDECGVCKVLYGTGGTAFNCVVRVEPEGTVICTCKRRNYMMEVYGRTQVLLNHCPRRTRNGDERQDDRCDACAKLDGCPATYTDRKGYRFPLRRLKMEHGCVLRLYNSVTTDMAKYAQKLHDTWACRFDWHLQMKA